jgi:DNA-binding MarR family transcriptional regulator
MDSLPKPCDVFRAVPCFCGRVLLVSRAMTRLYNDELRAAGIEATQFSMLQLLSHLGPMTQNELGERMAAGKTTVSRNVKLLQSHRWVDVEEGEDRRSRVVSLTEAGRKQMRKATPYWERAQKRIRAAMPEAQFKALSELLPLAAEAALSA